MSTDRPKKAYSKRSVRFWVTVYLTAGIVLYTAAYLLFVHKSGGGAGPTYGY